MGIETCKDVDVDAKVTILEDPTNRGMNEHTKTRSQTKTKAQKEEKFEDHWRKWEHGTNVDARRPY